MKKLFAALKKKSNSGSSLVTAIIVVAFMSILGTIALYISGQNYKMKVLDAANKRSFYAAEEVVEVLKTQLTLDVANATQRATKAAGAYYVEQDNFSVREYNYLENFRDEFNSIWNSHYSTPEGVSNTQAVRQLFGENVYTITNVSESGDRVSFNIEINGEVLTCEINDLTSDNFRYRNSLVQPADLLTTSLIDPTKSVPASYTIEDFNITVTDSKGFVSIIHTSFLITPPSLNWDSSKALTSDTDVSAVISEADYSNCVLYWEWNKE